MYFSQPWGEPWLASTTLIFLFPTFSLLAILLNSIIALLIHRHQPLLARLLLAFSLAFSLFSTVALYQIINLAI